MTEDQTPADLAGDEAVQPEAEQVEAAEAPESTEGQDETPPAEEQAEATEDKESRSKARRERRKAFIEELKQKSSALERENQRLAAQLDQFAQYEKTPPPKQEDFDNYDDYLAEKSAYAAMKAQDRRQSEAIKREAEERQRQLQQLETERMREARDNWAAQREEATSRYADFDAVISAPDLHISDRMAAHIAMSDQGADVAYFLGMNKDQARAIASLPPEQQTGAMAVLERMIPRSMPRPRTQSKAPEPISPVKPKASGMKNPEDMTPAEFDKWRANGGTFKL